jgi:GT2 family glycosyltransferase
MTSTRGDLEDQPEASVVITTRNRRDDLSRALDSAQRQTARIEIIVLDDASEDDTAELVAGRFPSVRYWRADRPLGYIRLRNRGAEMARAPIVFSIDDDAEFSSPEVVAQTLAEFDHPSLGAVSIPYLDDLPVGLTERIAPAPDARRWAVWAYIGTSHAVRRDVFIATGGYEPVLEHFVEEFDFGLRMLDSGFIVRLGRADPIVHHLSSQSRQNDRVWLAGERGFVLSALLLVPGRHLPPYLLRLLGYSVVHVAQGAPPRLVARGVARGYRDAWRHRDRRRPVRASTFRLRERLRLRGPLLLDECYPEIPAQHRNRGLEPCQ